MAGKNGKTQQPMYDDVDVSLGDFSAQDLQSAQISETDVMRDLAEIFNAGQAGFEAGKTKGGMYLGTKTAVADSAKKENWKPHPTLPGKSYRVIHIFQVVNPKTGEVLPKLFGIWNQGMLGEQLKRVEPNQMVGVQYVGQAEEKLKEEHASAPHTFKILGKNLRLKPDLSGLDQPATEATAPASGAVRTA